MTVERLAEQDLPDLAELFKQFWGESTSLESIFVGRYHLLIEESTLISPR